MDGRPDGIQMTQFCGRSQEFVDVRNLVVGYVGVYCLRGVVSVICLCLMWIWI